MNLTDSTLSGDTTEDDHSNRILVGLDGSLSSRAALKWAALEAMSRGLGLLLLHALSMPAISRPFGQVMRISPSPEVADQAERLLKEAVDQITERHVGLSVKTHVTSQDPATALLAAARTAPMIVVGSRGLSGFASALMGSVSSRVSAHAPCPVAVIRGPVGDFEDGKLPEPSPDGRVVVGLDGSYGAERALRFAYDAAARTGREVVAVHAWSSPAPVDATTFTAPAYVADREYFASRADKYVRELVESVRSEHTADVPVHITIADDHPAHALLAEDNTEVVVVGSRGRGGFVGLLLGSVSQTVLHNAETPVVVVR